MDTIRLVRVDPKGVPGPHSHFDWATFWATTQKIRIWERCNGDYRCLYARSTGRR